MDDVQKQEKEDAIRKKKFHQLQIKAGIIHQQNKSTLDTIIEKVTSKRDLSPDIKRALVKNNIEIPKDV